LGQYPPAIKKVEAEIDLQLQNNSNLKQVFDVYKRIFFVQSSYLDQINTEVSLTEEEMKDCFRNDQHILSCQDLKIDGQTFLDLLEKICQAIKEASPEAPDNLLELSKARELQESKVNGFLEDIKAFNKKELEQYVQDKEMDQNTGLDSEVISFAVFSALIPFFSSFMNSVSETVDFSLWRNSFCPVCGQKPVIAKHRKDDGARILECWLCHAQWNFPRLECPHCNNEDQGSLRFFYVPEDRARQVHVCEKCEHYLKIIDEKMLQKEVILDLEAIATGHLDVLANKEGYTLPEIASLLN